MKLGVAVNHCAPYHTGGSEKVVQQITESMHHDFGMDCHVISKYVPRNETYNGVHIHKLKGGETGLVNQVKDLGLDHLFVYSDSFVGWSSIVRNAEQIPCSKSIALVGMNYMRMHGDIGRMFANKKRHFTTITHSDNYLDYETCKKLDVPVKVIPNAIDLKEFEVESPSFRERYGIDTEHMILCVSNFFPGKGQEHLYHILQKLADRGHDFTAVYISTTTNFQPAEVMRTRHNRMLAKARFKSKALNNIPRSDVIEAFKQADVFAFPSQIEVAPLVVLECMANNLPWVALNVGNVEELDGGFIVKATKKVQGKWHYTTTLYDEFTDCLDNLLSSKAMRIGVGVEGKRMMLERFNWDTIKHEYKDVFNA